MKAPSASRWSCHESFTVTSSFRKIPVRGSPGPGAAAYSACRGIRLGLPLAAGVPHQRGRRLQPLLGEMALVVEQLLGEVVEASVDLLRLGQLAERQRHEELFGTHGLDEGEIGPDRLDRHPLARADGV